MHTCFFICMLICIGGQSCVDTVNVNQKGNFTFNDSLQVIVPNTKFSCNGRITGYIISLKQVGNNPQHYPTIQVWHPTSSSSSSSSYKRISQYELVPGDITDINNGEYYLANVSLSDAKMVEFQSGDIIGYYIPQQGKYYTVWNIQTEGYISYTIKVQNENKLSTNFTIIDSTDWEAWQPLIKVLFGKIVWCIYIHTKTAKL